MTPGFRYYLRVRYGECDAQKIVFNARYGDYIDLAATEFVRALGYGEAQASGDLDYSLVRQTTEWRAPARFDQVLELSVETVRLGITSFTLGTTFRVAGTPDVTATSETVYVLLEPRTHVKRPLPEAFRAALERGAPGRVTDHAAYLASLPPTR